MDRRSSCPATNWRARGAWPAAGSCGARRQQPRRPDGGGIEHVLVGRPTALSRVMPQDRGGFAHVASCDDSIARCESSMGNGTARVLAGYRRTAGRRGRGQTRPFQPADLAAVLATLGPTSPTRAAGVAARSSRESRGRHLVPITGHHEEPLFLGGAARSHAAASLPDQPPQNFTVHRYPPLELVGRDVFALLDDDPVVRRGVQSRPNPRGSSTSRASRATSHTPSRNSAVRDSASDSGRPSR